MDDAEKSLIETMAQKYGLVASRNRDGCMWIGITHTVALLRVRADGGSFVVEVEYGDRKTITGSAEALEKCLTEVAALRTAA